MKLLATNFRKDQFDFVQVKRQGDVAIFRKSKPAGYVGFEVVRIQQSQARTFPAYERNGNVYPAHEVSACERLPESEAWGTLGWSYSLLIDAEKRFNSLVGMPSF